MGKSLIDTSYKSIIESLQEVYENRVDLSEKMLNDYLEKINLLTDILEKGGEMPSVPPKKKKIL